VDRDPTTVADVLAGTRPEDVAEVPCRPFARALGDPAVMFETSDARQPGWISWGEEMLGLYRIAVPSSADTVEGWFAGSDGQAAVIAGTNVGLRCARPLVQERQEVPAWLSRGDNDMFVSWAGHRRRLVGRAATALVPSY
jgi:hypothetical protein